MFNRGAHPEREELLSLLLEEEEEDDELLEEEEVPSSSSPLCASSSASAAKSGRSLRICTTGIFDDSQVPIHVAITPQQDILLSKESGIGARLPEQSGMTSMIDDIPGTTSK